MTQLRLLHDSHDLTYRDPFGAVPCKTGVNLRLLVCGSQAAMVNRVLLHLPDPDHGGNIVCVPMRPEKTSIDQCLYSTKLTVPTVPGLVWYFFSIDFGGGTIYYGNSSDGKGGPGQVSYDIPAFYQITVHEDGLATPHWLKDSVIYQIFVDRFANGNKDGRVLNPKRNSLIHSHWDNTPMYIRDPGSGKVVRWDFFGGNLLGVRDKLPYLKQLGVGLIYLNPVFESPSNHKYDTADYHNVDAMFGGNEALRDLISEARKLGMRVILDGVFSHTGSDSIYFNREGTYPSLGAYQSKESPYARWYKFIDHPHSYECWWGVDTMPAVNELEPSFLDFLIHSENSVVKQWLRYGIKGWRLDVADELPDEFIEILHKAITSIDRESILIGEVWEDASNKVSYDVRRRYLLGGELDSVTNYPFRALVLDFCLARKSPADVHRHLMSLYENYPRHHFYSVMNVLGSHDVTRLLSALGDQPDPNRPMPAAVRELAVKRLKMASLWQFTFPGPPCVYYGDEAGLEGGADPHNRGTYPWGRENHEILEWYKNLSAIRNHYDVLRTGEWQSVQHSDGVYGFVRYIDGSRDLFGRPCKNNAALVLMNQDATRSVEVSVDVGRWFSGSAFDVLDNYRRVMLEDGLLTVTLEPLQGKLFIQDRWSANQHATRESGILLHPTSLPSDFGIGGLGKEAYDFVDFLHGAGQTLWQMLPLSPPGLGNSPYQSVSAFAGSPLLIDPRRLVEAGLVSDQELAEIAGEYSFSDAVADFDGARKLKHSVLRLAFSRWRQARDTIEVRKYEEYCRANSFWLDDFALFMALREKADGAPWTLWEPELAKRDPEALLSARRALDLEIGYHKFVQYEFSQQWQALRSYAHEHGVRIIGDLPIFVAHDSADVWSHRKMFRLDSEGQPVRVAGVPPDYFSETGQLWGNPVYCWEQMTAAEFVWWKQRFSTLSQYVDIIRVDHFRGFEACWEVPAEHETAVDGAWIKAPGRKLFDSVLSDLPGLSLIAEDLGYITPEVRDLKTWLALPGMIVAQFELTDGGGRLHVPMYQSNNVVYTGTHDNDTMLGWYRSTERGATDPRSSEEIGWEFIEMVLDTDARIAIVPLQDVLCLGSEARMNVPGTVDANWQWRFAKDALTPEIQKRLRELTERSGRAQV